MPVAKMMVISCGAVPFAISRRTSEIHDLPASRLTRGVRDDDEDRLSGFYKIVERWPSRSGHRAVRPISASDERLLRPPRRDHLESSGSTSNSIAERAVFELPLALGCFAGSKHCVPVAQTYNASASRRRSPSGSLNDRSRTLIMQPLADAVQQLGMSDLPPWLICTDRASRPDAMVQTCRSWTPFTPSIFSSESVIDAADSIWAGVPSSRTFTESSTRRIEPAIMIKADQHARQRVGPQPSETYDQQARA